MYEDKIVGMGNELLLHDCTIKRIEISSQTIIFYFPDGFFIAAEERSIGIARVEIVLDSIEYDMRCFYSEYIKKKPFEKSYYKTQEVSAEYLISLLQQNMEFTVLKYGLWESECLVHMIIEGKNAPRRAYISLCIEMDDVKEMSFFY